MNRTTEHVILRFIRWVCVRPTHDDEPYPDHFDIEGFTYAVSVVNKPIRWRWPIARAIRLWNRLTKHRD